ncbi:MAG: DUF2550 domain-containing protein [Propionicimonas sp.]|nr:DUF2550 domain-containing protein [Propionicimonas sp.]
MDWLAVTEVIAIVAALVVVLPIVWLATRRRWLARRGGLFDCSIRLKTTTPGTGWVLGVARYREDRLEWFRSFSLSLRPRLVFPRAQTRAGAQRSPDEIESLLLLDDQRVLQLDLADGRGWEASLSTDALTGLLSWLEAAPPGQGYQPRGARPVA